MKNDIASEVLAFLKSLPIFHCTHIEEAGTITKEDEMRVKVMLNSSSDLQSRTDRETLKQYILNSNFEDQMEINDYEREAMAEYLSNHAAEFYKLLLKTTS